MSYEGYYQYICPTGHEYFVDASVGTGGFESEEKRIKTYQCPKCQAQPQWFAAVDQTNGLDRNDPATYDRDVVEIARYDVPQRDHRDNFYMTIEIRYAPKDPSEWHRWSD